MWIGSRFDAGGRSPESNFELNAGPHSAKVLIIKENANGYRMGEVNSRRDSGAPERDFEPPAPAQGAQLSRKNGGIPGLFRADQQTERLSA
jgi:hypothetical protein